MSYEAPVENVIERLSEGINLLGNKPGQIISIAINRLNRKTSSGDMINQGFIEDVSRLEWSRLAPTAIVQIESILGIRELPDEIIGDIFSGYEMYKQEALKMISAVFQSLEEDRPLAEIWQEQKAASSFWVDREQMLENARSNEQPEEDVSLMPRLIK